MSVRHPPTSIEERLIPPDPNVVRSIGSNHRVESAIADLIDNSIDSGATSVLVRFARRGGKLSHILIIDNGGGLEDDAFDAAMTLGHQAERSAGALGHFGMGLKAASFSQANELTVLSQTSAGPSGRRLLRSDVVDGFKCHVLDPADVASVFGNLQAGFSVQTGTIVRWDELTAVPAAKDPRVTTKYIEETRNTLERHLGLVFHRRLATNELSISIDVFDLAAGEPGVPFGVRPLDPFGYRGPGSPNYPKDMLVKTETGALRVKLHIWPPKSTSRSYELGSKGSHHQGFFLYRHGRLLSYGGWHGVLSSRKEMRLARVEIDIENAPALFHMNVEKSKVHMGPDLVHGIESSPEFDAFLKEAERVYRTGTRREKKQRRVLAPGKGIDAKVRREIANQFDVIADDEKLDIKWRKLKSDDFLEVSHEDRVLYLNARYRKVLLGGAQSGVNDLPLVKALLFLLYEETFQGVHLGPRDKQNINSWNAILTKAAMDATERLNDGD